MREIFTVIKGNFRKGKGAYISIFILMLVVSVSLTTVIATVVNTRNRDKVLMRKCGLGDSIAALNEKRLKDSEYETASKLAEKIRSMESIVAKVDEIPVIYTNVADLNGKSSDSSLFVFGLNSPYVSYPIYDENDNLISQPELKPGDIIVPVSFRDLYDCNIGDMLYLGKDGQCGFRVAAYFEDPYMGSSMMGIKTLLVGENDMEMLCRKADELIHDGGGNPYGDIYIEKGVILSIFKEDGIGMNDIEFERELNSATSYAGYAWITLSQSQMHNYMLMLTNIFSGVLVAFIVILVFATLIVLSHNIGSSIEQGYVNFGILKAVGMTNTRLKQSVLLGYMLSCLLGVITGIPIAVLLVKKINSLTRTATGLYVEDKPAMGLSLLFILAILATIVLFIIIKLRRISRITPVNAMNNGRKDVHFSSWFKLPVSKKMLNCSLAYRQLVSGKRQYFGSVIITALLAFFMVMVNDMCIWVGNDDFLNNMFMNMEYDMELSAADKELLQEAEKLIADKTSDMDVTAFHSMSKYLLLNDAPISCRIIDMPEQFASVYKGRTCLYDNEVLITSFVADSFGVDIGDIVNVSVSGRRSEFVVSGIYQSANDSGKNFAMSEAGYRRLTGSGPVDYGYTTLYDIGSKEKINEIIEIISERYEKDEVRVENEFDFDAKAMIVTAVNGIAVLIYIISGVFIIVTVVMVCSKLFAREKQDYGIYKAMGFRSSSLRLQFAVRFAITSVLGSALGICLAVLFSDSIMSFLFSMFGISSFSAEINLWAALIPIAFMSVLYMAFAYFISVKIRKVQPRVLITE